MSTKQDANNATASPIEEVQQQLEQFKTEATQFWTRATKYDEKEYKQQLLRTAISLGVLGAIGYGAKLLCLPIVSFLVGA